MANVSRPMQAVPQLLLDSDPRDLGEPLHAGLETIRNDDERSGVGLPMGQMPGYEPTEEPAYPTSEENIRKILQLMKQAPPEEIRRRRQPMDLGPIEQRPQLVPPPLQPGQGPKLPVEEDDFPMERQAQRVLGEQLKKHTKRFDTDIDLPGQDQRLRDMQRKIMQEHREKEQGGLAPIPKHWGLPQQ
jgi:hypothetical protein